jgi:hypothetical protein
MPNLRLVPASFPRGVVSEEDDACDMSLEAAVVEANPVEVIVGGTSGEARES